jgi:hypothetical protein
MDALSPTDVKAAEFLPPFVTIERWTALSTMSRRATFVHIAKGHIVAHKVGRRTLVDVAASMAWIRSRPASKIRLTASHPKKGGRPGRKPGRAAGGIDAAAP